MRPVPAWVPALTLAATVGRLAVAEFVPGIDRFANKAFGARLVSYPVLMLLVPALWWWGPNVLMLPGSLMLSDGRPIPRSHERKGPPQWTQPLPRSPR